MYYTQIKPAAIYGCKYLEYLYLQSSIITLTLTYNYFQIL